MWLSNFLKLLKAQVQAYSEPLPYQTECQAFAADAFNYCVSLYGQPSDPKRHYDIAKSSRDTSSCSYGLGTYTILISRQCVTQEQLCVEIAHEMYHRVTMHRKGLRKKPYVDEALAFLTSLWFVEHKGFTDYATYLLEGYGQGPGVINIRDLQLFHRPTWYQRLRNPYKAVYAEGFADGVSRLAVALKRTVSRDDLCRLIEVNTLEKWVVSLPQKNQYTVSRILELPNSDKPLPTCEKQWGQLYLGLKAKGDYEAMVADFESISRLQPESHKAMFYLGRAHQGAEQLGPALTAYLKARELGSTDKWTAQNIGSVYWREKEYLLAAEWYGKAFEEGQQWAQARYWQGRALQKLGDLAGARSVWEQVLTLGDEEHLAKAREALEDYTPPDTEATPASG